MVVGAAIAAALLFVAFPDAGSAAERVTAERPTYSVGQRWILDGGEFKLTSVSRNSYVFTTSGGHEIHLSRDLAPIKIVREGKSEWEMDPAPSIRWPLEVGRWGMTRTGVLKNGRELFFSLSSVTSRVIQATWSIEAHEPRLVAGRPLDTFRISINLFAGPSGSSFAGTVTLWYAPEVRQLVRIDSTGPLAFGGIEVVALDEPPAVVETRPAPPATSLAPPPAPPPPVAAVATPKPPESSKPEAPPTPPVETPKRDAPPSVESPTPAPVAPPGSRPASPERPADEPRAPPLSTPSEIARIEPPQSTAPAEPRPEPPQAPTPPLAALRPPEPPPARVEPPLAESPAVAKGMPASPPQLATPAEPKPVPVPVVPLRLVVSAPADGTRVQQDSLGLAGVVTGGDGTRQVLVTVNGATVTQFDQPPSRAGRPINVPITLREGSNTLVVTATDASGQSQQEVRTVVFEKVTPLTLSVTYPGDQSRLVQSSTVVVAAATSGRGVAKISVSVNGVQVAETAQAPNQRSVPVTVPITLGEGANAIVIVATDADGAVRQEVRTVFYDAPKVAALPPPRLNVREQWAVVVGIGRYDNAAIPPLRYTVADAEAIYRTLLDAGFRKENVLLVTDRTERKPTIRDIKWALGTFLARSAKKDDLVLIFFAGHGAPETDPRGIERDGLAKYLIPSDADPDDLYSTAFPMDELQTIFGRIESERVVAFLDTCYSGAAGGRTFTVKRTRTGAVDELFLERLTRSKGRVIITASRSSEVSVELPELGHGVFTYYLVQGLKGAADGNRDGIVSLQELYEYVEQQVTRKSRSVGSPQHPVMKGEMEGPLPLIKLGRPAR